jgi:large subunit ribosomal protein L22
MTIQKNLKSSPRKLRLVADMVRKMTPAQAVLQLRFTNTAAAPILAKAIKTAVANGGNNESLVFKSIEINDGLKMRRIRVGTAGRGRNRPYKKRYSHIKIVVTDEVQNIVAKAEKLGTKMKNTVEKVIEENTEVVASSKKEIKSEETKQKEGNENQVAEENTATEEKK